MVGVPGRSKGCATCRRRKKGCDLQRPACGQCIKAGLQCGGYDRQRIFINHTADSSSKALVTASRTVRSQQKPSPSATQIVLPDSLTRSAYELKSLGLFWDAYLPGGQIFTSTQSQFTTGSWLGLVHSIYYREDALRHALLAMSLGIVGQRQGDSWMLRQGLASHGRALREMALAVNSPERSHRDELLAGTRLLSLFELLFGANDEDKFAQARSWSSHVEGELVLLRQRGPHGHMFGPAHQLFVDGRLNAIIAAVRSRKKTFLSSPEWKEIPWLVIPKTPKDSLFDIMVEVPTLMEKLDMVGTLQSPEAQHRQASEVVQGCWAVDVQLTEWVLNMNFVTDLDLDNLSHVEELGDLALAQLIYIYWVACILVSSTLRSANEPCAESQPLPPRIDPRIYARKIARSASYFFGPGMGIWCAHASSFPIGIAFSVLADPTCQDEEDLKLLIDVLSKGEIGDTIGKFLDSMRAGNNVNQSRL